MDVVYNVHTLMAFSGRWSKTDSQISSSNEETTSVRQNGGGAAWAHTRIHRPEQSRQKEVNWTTGGNICCDLANFYKWGRFVNKRIKSGPSMACEMHATKWRAGTHTHIHSRSWWSRIMAVFIALPTRWILNILFFWLTTGVLSQRCGDISSFSSSSC